MKWIKTWAKIEDQKQYLAITRAGTGKGKSPMRFYGPAILLNGCQVKQLLEGVYLATEFLPPKNLEECL